MKYETVAGSSIRLDVPPSSRPLLASPRRALWITEGIRKGDALASVGLCAVALLGVDSWRCDEDWARVSLDERDVYVVYDNDVMIKPGVYRALSSLAAFLQSKGAIVHFVYLPLDNGKVGVDDFLAKNGPDTGPLYTLAEDRLRELAPEPKRHGPVAWPAMWLLDDVEKLVRRFVRFGSEHEPVALALFVLHTWAIDAATATPYVLIVSPEKRSGKTRVLEVVELLVREPLRAANITAAGVFQSIEAWAPTLLVDEVDGIFTARTEHAEALRSVLNAGNRRGAFVVRGSAEGEPAKFATFGARVLAGINVGHLPDTIRDRSLVVALDRKRRDEPVDDLFVDDLREPIATLRDRLADWAAENVEALRGYRRAERILALDDRRQEAWDPLLAVAHLAGGNWPDRARHAAVALAKGSVDPAEEAHGHLLLVALWHLFERESKTSHPSRDICRTLNDDEELPFGHYRRFEGIDPAGLAKLLRPYGIRPKNVPQDGNTRQVKGYEIAQLDQAWQRYLSADDKRPREDDPQSAVSPVSPVSTPHLQGFPETASGNGAVSPVSGVNGRDGTETAETATKSVAVSQKPCKSAPETAETAETAKGGSLAHARVLDPPMKPPGSLPATCANASHRSSDWRMPNAARWVCGMCHPPSHGLPLIYREGDGKP